MAQKSVTSLIQQSEAIKMQILSLVLGHSSG